VVKTNDFIFPATKNAKRNTVMCVIYYCLSDATQPPVKRATIKNSKTIRTVRLQRNAFAMCADFNEERASLTNQAVFGLHKTIDQQIVFQAFQSGDCIYRCLT
jgi:hypothetical protein